MKVFTLMTNQLMIGLLLTAAHLSLHCLLCRIITLG